MAGLRGCRAAGCLLAGLLLCVCSAPFAAFTAAQGKGRVPPALHRAGTLPVEPRATSSGAAAGSAGRTALLSLCGAALAAAAAARRRVALCSQGQGGRFNRGQYYMPKLKGAKKMAVLRPRKPYGSHSARKVPRRYDLYDKLEEIDETVPVYTVVSEPEEPMQPEMDAPIARRYPWAGKLMKLHEEKQKLENDRETALEPYFGSFTKQNLPPIGRRQQYVFRRGWPRYNHPPWINRPLIGEGVKVTGGTKWKKDRRPQPWQLSRKNRRLYEEEQAKKEAEAAELEELPEEDDDLDAALDAMEEAEK